MKFVLTLFLAVLCALQGSAARAKPRLIPPPQSRESWRSVRTNHLFVIGNADADKLRQVATWLEFFHSAFARLVSRNVLDSSVPTTVIIFRDDASFRPFKPLYQGRPINLAGFFQPGEDVNYIALSLDPDYRDPFATAFHEYVHLHVRDNVPDAPLWLNEGLAELYGSLQFSGNDALLGAPLGHYIRLLREQELLPLTTLLSIGTNSPHYNEDDKSGIFYGESWALVHYLMLGERGRQEQFKRFLQQVGRGENAAKAIESSFGMSLDTLEQELRRYVRHGEFAAQRVAGVDNPQTYASYTAMQRSSLSDGEVNHYLGDLLMHIGRDKDAEQYFKQAIALDPSFIPPYASLGSVYVHQRRYAEAKKYLQKATTTQQSHLIHYYYAYILSREGAGPDGRINEYSKETAAAIREQLLRALKVAPDYGPAQRLLEMLDKSTGTSAIDTAAIAEPVRTGSVRTFGGDSGGVAIRDGRTIDSSASLPALDEVLTKYVEAMGGVKALNAVTTRVVKGSVDVAGLSRGGSFEAYAEAPARNAIVLQAHPLGTVKGSFSFFGPFNLKSNSAKVTLAGMSKIGFRDVYVLDSQPSAGTAERIYLDAQTYLPVRSNGTMTIGTTSGPVETYFDDWREVDGVKYPFNVSQKFPKLTLIYAVKEIRHNVPIDARVFAPR